METHTLFDIHGQTAVITGGSGALGSAMAAYLAHMGAKVVIVSRHADASSPVVEAIRAAGGDALGIACDVLDRAAVERAAQEAEATFGPVDILVNGAGGNHPRATTSDDASFFDLDIQAVSAVFDVNFLGAVQCCQVFGRGMAQRGNGCIVNIASMSALRPLTRVPAYSAAKGALVNFTQWLAVHMAQEYNPAIRVNAIAPGFFLTEQNRFLLTDAQSGGMTPRGQTIIAHTPMARLGEAEDLLGTLLWLVSPASAFVTGIVVPVDGGFAAFGGV
ncbi:MAG: SDR family oxidoreductase [Chloroflexota bacterium]|nr:SDR family oxidoreductase [Chloroflexota bacterium]